MTAGPYASLRPLFPLISLSMLLGGVAAAGLARFPLAGWVRRVLVPLPATALVLMIVLGAGHGLTLIPFHDGLLAVALLVAPWTPCVNRRARAGAPESDLALGTLAVVDASVGPHAVAPGAGAATPCPSASGDRRKRLGGAAANAPGQPPAPKPPVPPRVQRQQARRG